MMDFREMELLDRWMADVRAGRGTVAQCLEDDLEHGAEMEPLLRIALAIDGRDLRPTLARKALARQSFVEALRREPRPRGRWQPGSGPQPVTHLIEALQREGQPGGRWWLASAALPRVAAAAIALGIAASAGGAAIVTAQDALPGDPLYGLKTAVEHVQASAASSPEGRAEVLLGQAERRLAEVERAREVGRADAAHAAQAAYANAVREANAEATRGHELGHPASAELETRLVRHGASRPAAAPTVAPTRAPGSPTIVPIAAEPTHPPAAGQGDEPAPASASPAPTARPAAPPTREAQPTEAAGGGRGQGPTAAPPRDPGGSPPGRRGEEDRGGPPGRRGDDGSVPPGRRGENGGGPPSVPPGGATAMPTEAPPQAEPTRTAADDRGRPGEASGENGPGQGQGQGNQGQGQGQGNQGHGQRKR